MKRYALVRVDRNCPDAYEEMGNIEVACNYEECTCLFKEEEGASYGDTRDQLINKIQTGIEIAINEYEKGNIPKGTENRRCAEIIVKYLVGEEK